MVTFPSLQRPLRLGPLTLNNRVIMASLTRSRSIPIDVPNDINVKYYVQRARSGPGLILSEGTLVSPQGTEWRHAPGIYSNEHALAWKKVVDAVHAEGSLIYAQLWHVGRAAHPGMPLQGGVPVSAPSPIAARGGKFRDLDNATYVAPTAEHPNPWLLVEEFRRGASYAKAAGFDGVELHGANGYLFAQFFDPVSNQRTDEWGGSMEKRAKFILECLKVVIEVFGADRVGIKLNPAGGYNDMGVPKVQAVAEFSYLIHEIVELGLAYVQLVRFVSWQDATYNKVSRATQLDVLAEFGHLVKNTSTKLLLNGDLSPAQGEELVSSGLVDAVVYGRPFINNPDFVKRIFTDTPLNEDLKHPLVPATFYNIFRDAEEGYTDYPDAAEALRLSA